MTFFHLSLQLIEKTIILNMYLFDFWKNGGCTWIAIILLELQWLIFQDVRLHTARLTDCEIRSLWL